MSSLFDFDGILNSLDDGDLAEKPVDIDTFIADERYLNEPDVRLSPYQREAVLRSTQIYRKETLYEYLSPMEAEKRWDQTETEVILQFGKGCHAPETPVFNANTGAWQRLDSIKSDTLVVGMNEDLSLTPQYATEAFHEGRGQMIEVETISGTRETVYVGHQYYAMPWKKFENKVNWGRWVPAVELKEGDLIATAIGFDVVNPINISSMRLKEIVDTLDSTDPNAAIPADLWKSDNRVLEMFLRKVCIEGERFVTNSYQLGQDIQHAWARVGQPYKITYPNKYTWILTKRKGKVKDGLFWDKITWIRRKGEGDYWTLTQPETHNYIGNLRISHQSGKDMLSTFSCAYLVYLLMCLKNPAKYFDKPSGDSFDIINIAINSDQAKNVFFKGVVRLLKKSNYFKGKYDAKDNGEPAQSGEVKFDKNINLYSGHSEREAWEGYNTIMVVLDEISGFATESTSESKKTADAVYNMYRASVDSRFGIYGKVVLLSFPRYKGDFISTHYASVIEEKVTTPKRVAVPLNPDLPDSESNRVIIEWEEDDILSYKIPYVFALRRPTWEVNPTKKITNQEYVTAFYRNKPDATGRFACQPAEAIDAFFKDRQKIDDAMIGRNGVSEDGTFQYFFRPDDTKEYYIHVDLARKHDNCAVSLAHVESWQSMKIVNTFTDAAPVVYVDAVRWWTPTKEKSVDFTEVREYIVSLYRRGFNIKKVTFDQWESDDMRNYLEKFGIPTEKLSVAKKHYQDMAGAVGEHRVIMPDIELLKKELLQLRITNDDKVDHPRSGTKDLADATCGAIFNALSTARPEQSNIVEVRTIQDIKKENRNSLDERPGNVIIKPPTMEMPDDLSDYFSRITMI